MTYKKISEEDDRIDYRSVQQTLLERDSFIYVFIFGCLVLILWSTMITNQVYHDRADTSLEEKLLSITRDVVDSSRMFANDTVSRLEIIADENGRITDDHIVRVDGRLLSKKKDVLLRIKDIVTKTVADIEEEVESFTRVIKEAVRGIVDYLTEDTRQIVRRVDWAGPANVSDIVPIALSDMEYAIAGAMVDLDSMYSFYDDYVLRFVDNRAVNGTRKLSLYLNSNRKIDTNAIDENVRVCYRIGTQNAKLTDHIDRSLRAISYVLKSSEIIADLNRQLVMNNINNNNNNNNNSTRNVVENFFPLKEAQLIMNREFFKSNQQLTDIINEDRYFVGTELMKRSLPTHERIRNNILRQTRKAITNFDKSVNVTTTNFAIVRDDHWTIVKDGTDKILTDLRESIKRKSPLLPETDIGRKLTDDNTELFAELKSWMERKFANNTYVIKEDFEKRKSYFGARLKDSVTVINDIIVPVMSILSIDNYIPKEECGINVVFQKFVQRIFDDYLTESCVKPTYKESEDSYDVDNDNSSGIDLAKFDLTEFIPFAKFVETEKRK